MAPRPKPTASSAGPRQAGAGPVKAAPDPAAPDPVGAGKVADWLAGWAGQARAVGLTVLPDSVAGYLAPEIEAAEAALAPCDSRTMAVALARLAEFARSFSLPLDDIGATAALYRDALADLPSDLLVDGVARTIAAHRYHNMPKPGEIRARVEAELTARRTRLGRARLALSRTRKR